MNSISLKKIGTTFSSRYFLLLFKWLLALIFLTAIYQQVTKSGQFDQLKAFFSAEMSIIQLSYFTIAILLVIPNWMIEAYKWKCMSDEFNPLTYKQALEAILSGVTLGMITPSRVGEYGGKLIHIDPINRGKALSAGFISSLSQNIVHLTVGTIALIIFHQLYGVWSNAVIISMVGVASVGTLIMSAVYYFNGFFIDTVANLKINENLNGWLKKLKFDHHITQKLLNKILYLSISRYLVFTLQFVLILLGFNSGLSSFPAILGIMVVYLLQSGLPLPPVLSVLARVEIAILVFAPFQINDLGIISSTLSIWIINIMLPGMIGLTYLLLSNNLKTRSIDAKQ